jgi:3'(2'), 5'-bisphosphate nucleotidase
MLAIQAAIDASAILVKIYHTPFSKENKLDGSPVTEADKASSAYLIEALQKTNIPIVDEEAEEIPYEIRKKWDLSWCVDPLDGTKEFIAKNDEFSINIALIQKQKAVFGLITNPIKEEIIIGGKEIGVYYFSFKDVNNVKLWTKIEPSHEILKQVVLATSRSHLSPETTKFVEKIRSKVPSLAIFKMGSALKFFDLAKNDSHIYPRFAPTMEWDVAAGQAIMEALEGSVIDTVNKNPLLYNKENLKNPHFIVYTKSFIDNFQE